MSTRQKKERKPPVCDIPDDAPPSLRLRKARQDAGLSITDVAAKLRLRTGLVEAIEREDLAALGAPVFARGYVDGYVRLMGLPHALVDELLPRERVEIDTAPLQGSNFASHRRTLFDRFARRFVYIALTASIVIPVVLLATRDHLPDPAVLLTPLDAPMDASVALEVGPPAPVPLETATQMGPPATEQAVIASFTPTFYGSTRPTPPVAAVVEPAADRLVLELAGDSWVEVIGTDGSRLAHDLLRAGSRQSYDPTKVARVLLGNAGVVTVRMNGEEVDTTRFRRANVARFTVSSDGSLLPFEG